MLWQVQRNTTNILMTQSWANSKPEMCFVTSRRITKPTWPELKHLSSLQLVEEPVLVPDWCLLGLVCCWSKTRTNSASQTGRSAHVLKGCAKTGQFAVWAWNRQTGPTVLYQKNSCLSCTGILTHPVLCHGWTHTWKPFMSRRSVSLQCTNCANMHCVNKYCANMYRANMYGANMHCANICIL